MNDEVLEHLSRSQHDLERLFKLLTILDTAFIPPLSSRVDLRYYSSKVVQYAENIILVRDSKDIGYVAIYANDSDQKVSFITSIGVLPEYQGQGLGMELLSAAIAIAQEKGMRCIRLEVDRRNHAAIRIYQKANFAQLSTMPQDLPETSVIMECVLGNDD